MLHDPIAVFSTDRLDDVTVSVIGPIAQALGEDHTGFLESLRKAGASVLGPYPATKIEFTVSRLFGNATKQNTKVGSGLGPTDEMRLRNIVSSAAAYLKSIDDHAFISASVTVAPPIERIRTGRERSRYRWWRSENWSPQAI